MMTTLVTETDGLTNVLGLLRLLGFYLVSNTQYSPDSVEGEAVKDL